MVASSTWYVGSSMPTPAVSPWSFHQVGRIVSFSQCIPTGYMIQSPRSLGASGGHAPRRGSDRAGRAGLGPRSARRRCVTAPWVLGPPRRRPGVVAPVAPRASGLPAVAEGSTIPGRDVASTPWCHGTPVAGYPSGHGNLVYGPHGPVVPRSYRLLGGSLVDVDRSQYCLIPRSSSDPGACEVSAACGAGGKRTR